VPERIVFLRDLHQDDLPSSSHSLAGIDVVQFRRGTRDVDRRDRCLTLTFSDRTMSSDHGRWTREAKHWLLVDTGSKNASLIDGAYARRGVVRAGALVELGRTALVISDDDAVSPLAEDFVIGDTLPILPSFETVSPRFARVLHEIAGSADGSEPLLLVGASGTGKRALAFARHRAMGGPGAFVDWSPLSRANMGDTLFVEDLARLSEGHRDEVLRVIPGHGSHVVAASRHPVHYNLPAHRVVVIPSLFERREDLGWLTTHYLRRHAAGRGFELSPDVFRVLWQYRWPRNLRQLDGLLRDLLANSADGVIRERMLVAGDMSPAEE
jgi:hypothetical protein